MVMVLKTTSNCQVNSLTSSKCQTFTVPQLNTSTTPDTETFQERETSISTINNLSQQTPMTSLPRNGTDSEITEKNEKTYFESVLFYLSDRIVKSNNK